MLWLCEDVEHCHAPTSSKSSGELRFCHFDALGLLAASEAEGVVVADFASCTGSLSSAIALVEEQELEVVCVLTPEQASEGRNFLNSGQTRRSFFLPLNEETLWGALREEAQRATQEPDRLEAIVRASVHALGELLALAAPEAFGRGQRISRYCRLLARDVGISDTWTLDAAAVISQVGMISLSPAVQSKIAQGRALNADEERAMTFVPVIAEEITRGISELEDVRRLVRGAFGSDANKSSAALDTQVLRLAASFENSKRRRTLDVDIDTELQEKEYWPALVESARRLVEIEQTARVEEISLSAVRSGMILAEDVYDGSRLLLARGHVLQRRMVQRLQSIMTDDLRARRVRVIDADPS